MPSRVAFVALRFSEASADSTRSSSGAVTACGCPPAAVLRARAEPDAVIATGFYSVVLQLMFGAGSATVQGEAAVKIVAIALIVLGIIALLYGGITYTRREKVLDIGPIEATTQTRETIPLPPVLGVLAIVGGIALFVVEGRKRRA